METEDAPSTAPASETVASLRVMGLPVAGIADAMLARRAEVYAWLDGRAEPDDAARDRLRILHGLLSGESPGVLRYVHRLWERGGMHGTGLRDALTAAEIDPRAVRRALDETRPAALRRMERDAARETSNPVESSPAGHLTEYLVACLDR